MALSWVRSRSSRVALQQLSSQNRIGVFATRNFSTDTQEAPNEDSKKNSNAQVNSGIALLQDVQKVVPEFSEIETLQAQFNLLGAPALVQRQIAKDLIASVQEATTSKETSTIILQGEKGSGKSALLLQLVHWCRENNWLVLYAPAPKYWSQEEKAFYYGTMTGATLSPSAITPGHFGQPLGAQYVLEAFVNAHEERLKQLPAKREYPSDHYIHNEAEEGENQRTLFDLANSGIKQLRCASDALSELRLELALVTEVPVLIAVDEYNTLHWPTCFHSEGSRLTQDKLQLSSTFRLLNDQGEPVDESLQLMNGVCVGATTNLSYRKPYGEKMKKVELGPFDLQGFLLEKMKLNNAAQIVNVPEYTSAEFDTAVTAYRTALESVGSETEVSPSKVKSVDMKLLEIATARVPGKVFDILSSSGMPRVD